MGGFLKRLGNLRKAPRLRRLLLALGQPVFPFLTWWLVHRASGGVYGAPAVDASAAVGEAVAIWAALGCFLAIRWFLAGPITVFFLPALLLASVAFPLARIAAMLARDRFDALWPVAVLLMSDSEPGVLWLPRSIATFASGGDLSWGVAAAFAFAMSVFLGVDDHVYVDLGEYLKLQHGSRMPLWGVALSGAAACALCEVARIPGGLAHPLAAWGGCFLAVRSSTLVEPRLRALRSRFSRPRARFSPASATAPAATVPATPAAVAGTAGAEAGAVAVAVERVYEPPKPRMGRFEGYASDDADPETEAVEPDAGPGPAVGPVPAVVAKVSGFGEVYPGEDVDSVDGDEGSAVQDAGDDTVVWFASQGVAPVAIEDGGDEGDAGYDAEEERAEAREPEERPLPAAPATERAFSGQRQFPTSSVPAFEVASAAAWTDRIVNALLTAPSASLFAKLRQQILAVPEDSRDEFADKSANCRAAMTGILANPTDQSFALAAIRKAVTASRDAAVRHDAVAARAPAAPAAQARRPQSVLAASIEAASTVGSVVDRSAIDRALDRTASTAPARAAVPRVQEPAAVEPRPAPAARPSPDRLFIPGGQARPRVGPQIPRPAPVKGPGRPVAPPGSGDDENLVIQSLGEMELGRGAVHRAEPAPAGPSAPAAPSVVKVASEGRLTSDLDLLRGSPALAVADVVELFDDMLHLSGKTMTGFATDFVVQTNAISLESPAEAWVKTTEAIWRVSRTSDPSRQLSILLGVIEAAEQGLPDKRLARSKLAMFGSKVYRRRMDEYVASAVSALSEPSASIDKEEAAEALSYLGRVSELFPSAEATGRLDHFERTVGEYRRRALVEPESRSSGESQKDFLFAGVASVAESKFSPATRRLLAYFDDMSKFFDVIEQQISVDCMQSGVDRATHEMTSLHEDLIARAAGVISSLDARAAEITREVGVFLDRAGSSLRTDAVRFVMNLNRRSSSALYGAAVKARARGVLNTSEQLAAAQARLGILEGSLGDMRRQSAEESGNRAVADWGMGSGDPFEALSRRLASRVGMDEAAVSRFPFSPLQERRYALSRRVEGASTTWTMASTSKGPARVFVYASRDGHERRNTVLFPVSGGGACLDLARIGSDLVLAAVDSPWLSYGLSEVVERLRPMLLELDAYDFKFLVFNATFTDESAAAMSSGLRPGMQHTAFETGMVVVRADLDGDSPSVGYASGHQKRLRAILGDGAASVAAPAGGDGDDEDGDEGDGDYDRAAS